MNIEKFAITALLITATFYLVWHLGRWYEYGQQDKQLEERLSACITINYELDIYEYLATDYCLYGHNGYETIN